MKILLVNKFYYLRGGDCSAVFNTEQLLKAHGHAVALFSMQHPLNVRSDWEHYFPKEASFSFSDILRAIRAIARIFHSSEVARKFRQLLDDFQPDVVHLHNIHSYLSPLVARIAHQRGIRVVWTLHDYKLVCPSYSCLRKGSTCEACFKNKCSVIRHRCMKDSFPASVLAWLEACYWHREKLSRLTDMFISPSVFLKTKMTQAGYLPEQIAVLSNFLPEALACSTEKNDYYCYVGRLSEEKGVETLLEVAADFPLPLKVIGAGPLLETYQKKYSCAQVEFLGQQPQESLFPIVQKARFIVLPSVWYENNPLSIIEALSMGTPVCGACIGGIPELITAGKNGYLFRPGDKRDLLNSMTLCFEQLASPDIYRIISMEAQNKFGAAAFYDKLMNFYETSMYLNTPK